MNLVVFSPSFGEPLDGLIALGKAQNASYLMAPLFLFDISIIKESDKNDFLKSGRRQLVHSFKEIQLYFLLLGIHSIQRTCCFWESFFSYRVTQIKIVQFKWLCL